MKVFSLKGRRAFDLKIETPHTLDTCFVYGKIRLFGFGYRKKFFGMDEGRTPCHATIVVLSQKSGT